MKPLRTWLARLAFVGAWAIVSGCGSGDVPDPSNDGSAQIPGQSAPPELTPPPAAANPQVASADTGSEEAKPEESAAAPQAAAPVESAAEAASASAPPASTGPAAPDKNSATAELLALSNKEPQPAPPASGDAASPSAPGAGGPAAGPGPGGPGPGGGPPNMGPNAPGGGMMGGGMQGMMQQQQQMQQQQMQQMQAQMQGQMRRGMGGPGGPGAPGGPGGPGGMMGPEGPGGPGGSSKAPDFRSPQGAVQAFLDALKEKDLGRLTDATALRAPAEATKRNQDMFTRILDGTYSKEEIDKLANHLDGYKISGFNQAKSTGRLGVILSKRGQNRSTLRITITARREKKGWGVCDISNPSIIKSPQFGFSRRSSSSSTSTSGK